MTTRSPLAVVKENLLRLMCCLTDVVASHLSSISVIVQSFNGILPDNLLSCVRRMSCGWIYSGRYREVVLVFPFEMVHTPNYFVV